jgi:hypothetical protein
MFSKGDIVRFKHKDQWPGIELGIVTKIILAKTHSYMTSNFYQVRFEGIGHQLYHFTIPVEEEWMEKV